VPESAPDRQINQRRIHEQIVEKGLHLVERPGPSQIHEYNAHALPLLHLQSLRRKISSSESPLVEVIPARKIEGCHEGRRLG
jgi:hypothetical protein